jgi:hypothetical protein
VRHLLYCIFRRAAEERGEPGVRVIEGETLAAAASPAADESAAPGVSRLLDYQNVIASFHARRAVIPLRYGCFLESEGAAIRLLEARRAEFESLLDRLDGMTEMGIRVLLEGAAPSEDPAPRAPGAAYLARLRRRYGAALLPAENFLAGEIGGALGHCWGQFRAESSAAAGRRMLSLYFLTPKSAVENFRARVRELQLQQGVRLLVSGPWPPYNFVSSTEWTPSH